MEKQRTRRKNQSARTKGDLIDRRCKHVPSKWEKQFKEEFDKGYLRFWRKRGIPAPRVSTKEFGNFDLPHEA
jgi:hypothetical protein